MAFLPLFLQAVMGFSATNSGVLTIPLMIGTMITSITSGFALRYTGYKIWLLIGPPMAAFGMYMISTLHAASSATDAIIYMIIIGAGLGAVMSNYIVAAQNVMPKKDMGVVTSSMSLFRSIGGTMGIAILGAIMNSRMIREIATNVPPSAAALLPTTDANSLGNLLLNAEASAAIPQAILDSIQLSLSNSITYVFFIGSLIVLSALVISALIRSVPLKSAQEYHRPDEPPMRPTKPKTESAPGTTTATAATERSRE